MPDSASVRFPSPSSPRFGTLLLTALYLLALLAAPAAPAATTLTASTLLNPPETFAAPQPARLAIVIDDVGYNLRRAERALALPLELTLGLLPYAPHAPEIAERAHRSGREIILHQPMEPLTGERLEPGTLHLHMNAETFGRAFTASLARFPYAAGVNNHTGSLLTAHRTPMEWLMTRIAGRGLYFLDSRTTPDSVAEETARALSVPTIRRDVFLDHVPSEPFMARAYRRSLAIARARGQVVVIAHPHPATLAFLERTLAELPDDIALATLGDLVQPFRRPGRNVLARLESPAAPSRSPDR